MVALVARTAFAEHEDTKQKADEGPIEHTIIVGVGGASEIELGDGTLHPGANVMVEWDAIENRLELELEGSVLSEGHGTEVPISLVIKKPFHLTRRAEIMIGLGPELVHVSNPATRATYFGGQLAVDFMFWPTQRFGLWVEPSYDLIARDGLSHGVGSTGGLLVGW